MAKSGLYLLVFLVLLATTVSPAMADSGGELGHSPYAAQPLNYGLNIGTLAAGESHWYVFSSSELSNQPGYTLTLDMVYRPSEHDVTPYVNFHLLTFDQADRWLRGYDDVSPIMGVFITTDFDQATSERLWSGGLLEGETYYVRVFNNSQRTVEYHLTALGQPRASGTEAKLSKTKSPAQPGPTVIPVSSSDNSLTLGATSEETEWLLIAAAVQHMSTQEGATWLKMADQVGWLPRSNGTASAEYSVSSAALRGGRAEPAAVTGAEASPSAGGETAPMSPAPSLFDLYPNVYPVAPLALHDGANVGRLAPGGEHWYSFIHDDYDTDWYDYMALSLFSTPTDGNDSHHINFQIFTGDQLHIWQRGTPQAMRVMGDGQWVSRDKDPVTGERVWAGKVVEGDLYYVRVFNHTSHVTDYYLITGDIVNTELGDQVWVANRPYTQVFWQPTNYVRVRP